MNNNLSNNSDKRQSRSSRHNVKHTSASNVRQAMNQRRHDLSAKIRKSKRTHHIQLKRRYNACNTNSSKTITSSTVSSSTGSNIIDNTKSNVLSLDHIIHQFMSSPNEDTLTKIHQRLCKNTALLTSSSATNNDDDMDAITKLLLVDHPGTGNEFINILHSILTTSANSNDSKLNVLHILTNLAATNNYNRVAGHNEDVDVQDEDADNSNYYYGPSSTQNLNNIKSWCELIIVNLLSTALIPCLHCYLEGHQEQHQQLQIMSQTCWVIGNLAGEDSKLISITATNSTYDYSSSLNTTRRFMINNTNVIQELIFLVKRMIQHNFNNTNTEQINDRMRNNSIYNSIYNSIILEILRNSLWALSNLSRGSDTSGLSFLVSKYNTGNESTLILLSSSDIVSILKNNRNDNQEANENTVTWVEVHIELYWLLAFITAREDEVINLLFLQDNNHSLLDIIICHLHYATDMILNSFKKCEKSNAVVDLLIRMIIPILRIIGNTSCALSGQYVPHLITRCHPQHNNETIVTILSKWMYIIDHHPTHDIMSISTEATWVCGALLCDAGYDQHPSTTVACPILIPALCHVFIGSQSNRVTNATLDWKREILSALWNAISIPPHNNSDSNYNSLSVGDDTIVVRDLIVKNLCGNGEILKTMVAMIQSFDSDAMYLSLSIINVVHRRILNRLDDGGIIKRALNDADCLNILEGVCDSASANVQYGGGKDWERDYIDDCAEVAANLIDDFYDEVFHEDDDHDIAVDTSNGFTFNLMNNNAQQHFDFSGGLKYNITNANTVTHQVKGNNLKSAGRGRNNVMPAWMTSQK